jgi:hypothetical protein
MATLAQALAPLVDAWTRERHRDSCDRKEPYLRAGDALAVLDSWWGEARDPTCDVYGCTRCGLYHLGRYAGEDE